MTNDDDDNDGEKQCELELWNGAREKARALGGERVNFSCILAANTKYQVSSCPSTSLWVVTQFRSQASGRDHLARCLVSVFFFFFSFCFPIFILATWVTIDHSYAYTTVAPKLR